MESLLLYLFEKPSEQSKILQIIPTIGIFMNLIFTFREYKPILKATIKYFSSTQIQEISSNSYQEFIQQNLHPGKALSAGEYLIYQFELLRLSAVSMLENPDPELVFDFLETQILLLNSLESFEAVMNATIEDSKFKIEVQKADFFSLKFHSTKGSPMQ